MCLLIHTNVDDRSGDISNTDNFYIVLMFNSHGSLYGLHKSFYKSKSPEMITQPSRPQIFIRALLLCGQT